MPKLRKIFSYILLTFVVFIMTATAFAAPDTHRVQDKVNQLLEQDANGQIGPKKKVIVLWEFSTNMAKNGEVDMEYSLEKICRAAFSYKDYYVSVNDTRIYRDIYTLLERNNTYKEVSPYISSKNLFQIDDVLTKDDYANIAARYGYDYLVILPFYRYNDRKSGDGVTYRNHETKICLKAKVIDLNSYDQRYIYRKDIVRSGTSTSELPFLSLGMSHPSKMNAEENGVFNCLQTMLTEIRQQKVLPNIEKLEQKPNATLAGSIDDWYGDSSNFYNDDPKPQTRRSTKVSNQLPKNLYGPTNY